MTQEREQIIDVPITDEPTLTVREVAQFTGLRVPTINYHIHVSGRLKGVLVNARLRKFRLSEVEAFMADPTIHKPGPLPKEVVAKDALPKGRPRVIKEHWKMVGGVGAWKVIAPNLRVRVNKRRRQEDNLTAWFFDWAREKTPPDDEQRHNPVFDIPALGEAYAGAKTTDLKVWQIVEAKAKEFAEQ